MFKQERKYYGNFRNAASRPRIKEENKNAIKDRKYARDKEYRYYNKPESIFKPEPEVKPISASLARIFNPYVSLSNNGNKDNKSNNSSNDIENVIAGQGSIEFKLSSLEKLLSQRVKSNDTILSSLCFAIDNNSQLRIIELLIQHGANLNEPTSCFGCGSGTGMGNILNRAAYLSENRFDPDLFYLLITLGVDPSISNKECLSDCPLPKYNNAIEILKGPIIYYSREGGNELRLFRKRIALREFYKGIKGMRAEFSKMMLKYLYFVNLHSIIFDYLLWWVDI